MRSKVFSVLWFTGILAISMPALAHLQGQASPGAEANKPALSAGSVVDEATKVRTQEAYGNLPLYFIQNDGQVDKKVKFYEKGSGHSTFFTKDGVYLSVSQKSEDRSQKSEDRRQKTEDEKKISTSQPHNSELRTPNLSGFPSLVLTKTQR